MKSLFFLSWISIITAMFCESSYSQFAITSQVSNADVYTDVVPDKSISGMAANHSSYIGGSFFFDIDRNGSDDFKFVVTGGGALGGGSTICVLVPLSSNYEIVAHSDTSFGYPGVQYIKMVPDSLDSGIMINSNLHFKSDPCYLWSSAYGYESQPSINSWNNTGDHYIGARLVYPNDTLYGWIRVNVSFVNYLYTLTVKDYACNVNSDDIAEVNNLFQLNIYPNPVIDKVTICSLNTMKFQKMTLYNCTGQIMMHKRINAMTTEIDLSFLTSGIYLLKAENNRSIIFRKIIKEK